MSHVIMLIYYKILIHKKESHIKFKIGKRVANFYLQPIITQVSSIRPSLIVIKIKSFKLIKISRN